jgi:hypothetical protein
VVANGVVLYASRGKIDKKNVVDDGNLTAFIIRYRYRCMFLLVT